MSLSSYKNRETEFPPEGATLGILVECIDLGTVLNEKFGRLLHQIRLTWELPVELMSDGRPFLISKIYTLSLFGSHKNKSKLRADLEAWRGKEFKKQELDEGFNFSKLLGHCCTLTITHSERNGRTYANILSVGAVPKGQETFNPFHALKFLDLDAFDQEVFESLTEWVRKRIEESAEFKKIQELRVEPPEEELVEGDDDQSF
jgi:hypothetical protein